MCHCHLAPPLPAPSAVHLEHTNACSCSFALGNCCRCPPLLAGAPHLGRPICSDSLEFVRVLTSIKLVFPTPLSPTKMICQVPYGVCARAAAEAACKAAHFSSRILVWCQKASAHACGCGIGSMRSAQRVSWQRAVCKDQGTAWRAAALLIDSIKHQLSTATSSGHLEEDFRPIIVAVAHHGYSSYTGTFCCSTVPTDNQWL